MNANRFICILIVVFTASLACLGQERQITEEELKNVISISSDKRKGLPRREKTTTTGYTPGDHSDTIWEFGGNDTYHVKTKRVSNGVETETETIRIGLARYMREKDGGWIKEQPKPASSGQGSGNGTGVGSGKVDSNTEYVYLGARKIDGQRTDQYRKTIRITYLSGTPVRTTVGVYEYWFREDGFLVRESHESGFDGAKQRYKSVTDYEYPKEIKITAPIPD